MKNKRAMITGASGGLGKEISLKLASEGCDLVLLGRSTRKLKHTSFKVSNQYPDINVDERIVDLSIEDDVISFLNTDIEVDILVNCAGIFPLKNLSSSTIDDYNKCFNVNVKAPFLLTSKLAEGMKRRKWGRVVNVCSSSSYNGSADTGLYCSSKHALLGLSRSQYLELKPYNIRVFSVSPGSIQTDMGATDTRQNFSTFINPVEIADYIAYMIKLDKEMISEEVRMNRVIVK